MKAVLTIAYDIQQAQNLIARGALEAASDILAGSAIDLRNLALEGDRFRAALADDDEIINPYGSGPVPIEPREG